MKARFLPLLVLGGCAATATGSLRDDGYHHDVLPYRVLYADAQRRKFVSADWDIDNYYMKYPGKWEPKTGPEYRTQRVTQLRSGEYTTRDEPAYDLRLRHRTDNGVLWLRAEFVPISERDRELEVFIHNYVENLAGSSYFTATLLSGPMTLGAGRSKTWAATLIESRPTKVGDFPAYEAVIEVASVEQLTLDPQSRSDRIHIVLVDLRYRVFHREPMEPATTSARSLLFIGYRNDPDRFAASEESLARLLDSLRFDPPSKAGYELR